MRLDRSVQILLLLSLLFVWFNLYCLTMPFIKHNTKSKAGIHLRTYWKERKCNNRSLQPTETVKVAKVISDGNLINPQTTKEEMSATNSRKSSLSLSADISHTSEVNMDAFMIDSNSLTPLVCDNSVSNNEPSIKLFGRRIINIDHFLSNIMEIAVHAPFNCTIADMYPYSENRRGFISIIKLRCRMCGIFKVVTTDEIKDRDNINAQAVMGMVITGGGHSQLQEFCAALDMPCMQNYTWSRYHDMVSDNFHDVAWKLMSEAAKEEANIALAEGAVDKDGFPCITVVADAAWAKRSYKTRYDSLSGVAVIVGYKTKKVLFIGVRNKYCSICERASRDPNSTNTKEHKCFKNWTGPSTAMESDAIVEGFRTSVEMHGLKYTKLIGDGDSSVHRKLIEALPYGPSQLVQKIECRNHVLRGYCSRLQTICLNRKVGSVIQRDILKRTIKRLRCSVTYAIKYRKQQQDLSHDQRVEELRQDILNGPYHVFGQHDECKNRNYFCNATVNFDSKNLVPSMEKTGFFQDIQAAVRRVAGNASSLIWDVDNNLAELYNSHVAKAIGGKRVNFALRGSYEARCKAAVVSMNSNGTLLRETQNSIGTFTKKFIDTKINERAAKKRRRRDRSVKAKSQSFITYLGDDDYGPNAAFPQIDILNTELNITEDNILQNLYSGNLLEIQRKTR